MAGPSWLVDGNRIATKIRSASGAGDPERVEWKSNPTKPCPSCHHVIDNSDVAKEWPGLPKGVKFDPSDQEIIWHLLAKAGLSDLKPHPFIDEFIPTVDRDDGICYTHPQNLPGVKKDRTAAHFFHRAIKAYSTGTRKRRKINDDDFGEVRWHKTGRTKPVMLNGVQRGCKKIMVLYMSVVRGGKAEKTNWVMHQYHLGTEEDEKDGDYVISKISYQQQQGKQDDKIEQDILESTDAVIPKVDPVTPKSVTPDPPRTERHPDFDLQEGSPSADAFAQQSKARGVEEVQSLCENPSSSDQLKPESPVSQMIDNNDNESQAGEDHKWCDSESQNVFSQSILNTQQLAEALTLCGDFFNSQPDGNTDDGTSKGKSIFSDYAHLGSEHLKKDLEDCQKLIHDQANIELDTPPEVGLSQLEFISQDSFVAFGGSKVIK